MSDARRHHQHIAGLHFLRFSTRVLRSADLSIARVLRVFDAATIEDCGFSVLYNEDIRPVLVELTRTASVTAQDFEFVIAEIGEDLRRALRLFLRLACLQCRRISAERGSRPVDDL